MFAMIVSELSKYVKNYRYVSNLSEIQNKHLESMRMDTGVRVRVGGNLIVASALSPGCTRFERLVQRTPITSFTQSAARRLQRYLRECTSEYRTLITLTYPSGHGYDGQRAKRDLKVFVQRLYRVQRGNPRWSVCWFMEFQRRGSIHFHLLCTDDIPRQQLSLMWYEVCGTEDKRHLAAGTNVQRIRSGRAGVAVYARKYAAKHAQKTVPEKFGWSGRFWGVAGIRIVVSADIDINTESYMYARVRKTIIDVQNRLDNDVFFGKSRMLGGGTRETRCYAYDDMVAFASVKRALYLLNVQIDMECPHCGWARRPEVVDKSVWEGYEDAD